MAIKKKNDSNISQRWWFLDNLPTRKPLHEKSLVEQYAH